MLLFDPNLTKSNAEWDAKERIQAYVKELATEYEVPCPKVYVKLSVKKSGVFVSLRFLDSNGYTTYRRIKADRDQNIIDPDKLRAKYAELVELFQEAKAKEESEERKYRIVAANNSRLKDELEAIGIQLPGEVRQSFSLHIKDQFIHVAIRTQDAALVGRIRALVMGEQS